VSEPAKFDDLDIALIDELSLDGRLTNRALAARLGINEVTVAARLRRLAEAGVVRVVALRDIVALGHEILAFALVRVDGVPVDKVVTELVQFPESVTVAPTLGRYRIAVCALATDLTHFRDLTNRFIAVPGIRLVSWEIAMDVLSFRSQFAALGTKDLPVEPRGSTDRVDELDLQIIDLLGEDARASNRKIGKKLGVSEGTVRPRIKRLEDERIIKIVGIRDLTVAGKFAFGYVGISVAGCAPREVAAEISGLPSALAIITCVGQHDVVVIIGADTPTNLAAEIHEQIAPIPGVFAIETLTILDIIKHSYTWARLV